MVLARAPPVPRDGAGRDVPGDRQRPSARVPAREDRSRSLRQGGVQVDLVAPPGRPVRGAPRPEASPAASQRAGVAAGTPGIGAAVRPGVGPGRGTASPACRRAGTAWPRRPRQPPKPPGKPRPPPRRRAPGSGRLPGKPPYRTGNLRRRERSPQFPRDRWSRCAASGRETAASWRAGPGSRSPPG